MSSIAAAGENLKINGARLWDSLMEMAKIGPGVAGGDHPAFASRRHLHEWCPQPATGTAALLTYSGQR